MEPLGRHLSREVGEEEPEPVPYWKGRVDPLPMPMNSSTPFNAFGQGPLSAVPHRLLPLHPKSEFCDIALIEGFYQGSRRVLLQRFRLQALGT